MSKVPQPVNGGAQPGPQDPASEPSGIFTSGLSKPPSSATAELLSAEVQGCWDETEKLGRLTELVTGRLWRTL